MRLASPAGECLRLIIADISAETLLQPSLTRSRHVAVQNCAGSTYCHTPDGFTPLSRTRPAWRHVLYRRGDCAQIGGDGRIFPGQLVDVADLDVSRYDARPLGAGAQEPAAMPDQPCSVERVAGDQQLHALAAAQVRSDDDPLGGPIGVQQEQLQRITEIIVVELVVADAVKPNWRAGRHHEIECGP